MMVASGPVSARPHEIADLHVCRADATRDRRADLRVVELDLEIFQRGAVRFSDRARHVDLGLRVVERDHGGRVLGDELGVALHVALGLLELRLRAGDDGFDALDLGLDRRLSSVNSRSPCLTLAPSLKWTSVISLSRRVLTATLADRRHGAERLEAHRHGFLHRVGDLDRDRARPTRRGLRDGAAGPPAASRRRDDACRRKQRSCPQHQYPFLHYHAEPGSIDPLGLPLFLVPPLMTTTILFLLCGANLLTYPY